MNNQPETEYLMPDSNAAFLESTVSDRAAAAGTPREPIPGVNPPPVCVTLDDGGRARWSFVFLNGYSADVIDLGYSALIADPDVSALRVLTQRTRRGRRTVVASRDVAPDDLQQHLDAIADMPSQPTPLERIQAVHVALGDILDAIAEVAPEVPLSWASVITSDSGSGSVADHISIDLRGYADHRVVLRTIATRLGIVDGWDPDRFCGRDRYRYCGKWEDFDLQVACSAPWAAEKPVAPLPEPLPPTDETAAES